MSNYTWAWEGGEKGRGTKTQARTAPNTLIKRLFPLQLIFWASNQAKRIYIIRGPGLYFSSELSLLAACQNMSWVFNRAGSQDCKVFIFFNLLWKGLIVFIYCKQVGRAYKRSFVQQDLVSCRHTALFEYFSFVWGICHLFVVKMPLGISPHFL